MNLSKFLATGTVFVSNEPSMGEPLQRRRRLDRTGGAGRELRVMVKPDVIDDLEAHVLAREVAKQIEVSWLWWRL
ncbi:MAG: hypothetical protein WCG47_04125 [Dermatophilaceae bacterium]